VKKKIVAFIPARSKSTRLKDKNIKKLNGLPLLAHSILSAKKSKCFTRIIIVTDSDKYNRIATKYGAESFGIRPKKISNSKSPDQLWVKWIIDKLEKKRIFFDAFSILRPTSPFRSSKTIKRATNFFLKNYRAYDSLRAVEKTKVHPGKIWKIQKKTLIPIIKKKINNVPWHSCQYAALPTFYNQNASLEICKLKSFKKHNLISGKKILAFKTKGNEGFDINYDYDFKVAEQIVKK
tara:strand:+ start:1282 stop:1989 length:708 start_codon:yes stop_codon:yes gene_type:complete